MFLSGHAACEMLHTIKGGTQNKLCFRQLPSQSWSLQLETLLSPCHCAWPRVCLSASIIQLTLLFLLKSVFCNHDSLDFSNLNMASLDVKLQCKSPATSIGGILEISASSGKALHFGPSGLAPACWSSVWSAEYGFGWDQVLETLSCTKHETIHTSLPHCCICQRRDRISEPEDIRHQVFLTVHMGMCWGFGSK